MNKKLARTIVYVLVIALLICTVCGYRIVDQDVAIEGWSYADRKTCPFHLGNFDVAFLANGEEGQVSLDIYLYRTNGVMPSRSISPNFGRMCCATISSYRL